MVPDKKNPVGRKLLMKWIAGCRFALAFQQMHLQSEMRLTHEIVEADGSKSLTNHKSSKTWSLARGKRKLSEEHKAALERQQKKLPLAGFARRVANNSRARGSGKKIVHHGRMLWVVGRFSKKRIAMPMRPRSTLQGAPGPGEDLASVKKALRKFVDSESCVGASDSAPALLSGFKSSGMPVVGARHYVDEMTPFKRIAKKDLSPKQKRMLDSAANSPTPAALKQKTGYKIVAGDNATESWISATKGQLRRQNRMGRAAPKEAHLDQLAVQRLLVAPGLKNLLQSFALLRSLRCNHIGHSPKDFCDVSQDSQWLFE